MDNACKNFNDEGLFCELTGDDCCRENCDFCEINKENYNGRDIFNNGEQV